MDIRFKSDRPRDEVAKQMATWLQDWFHQDCVAHIGPKKTGDRASWPELDLVWDEERQKYEISPAKDFKLYVEEGGQFGYLDRYHPPERIAFLVEKLEGWEGASDVQQRRVVKES